jgi:hypothetical protein
MIKTIKLQNILKVLDTMHQDELLDNSVKMENSIQPGMIKYSIAALNRKLNR